MAWFHSVLILQLVAQAGTLSHDHSTWYNFQGGSQTRIYMAAILPDARRSLNTAHTWPFSIQNVSPAIDVALRRVNNDRIVFDVK